MFVFSETAVSGILIDRIAAAVSFIQDLASSVIGVGRGIICVNVGHILIECHPVCAQWARLCGTFSRMTDCKCDSADGRQNSCGHDTNRGHPQLVQKVGAVHAAGSSTSLTDPAAGALVASEHFNISTTTTTSLASALRPSEK